MKENFTQISERLRKYLIRIKYRDEYYFTVFGADLKDHEVDKLMVDGGNNLLLFLSRNKLKYYLKQGNLPFDKENLNEWAFFLSHSSKPYQDLDLDSLIDVAEGIEWSSRAFKILGVIEDYARQVNDGELLSIIEGDVINLFKNNVSDILIWRKSLYLKNNNDLISDLNKIYRKIHLSFV